MVKEKKEEREKRKRERERRERWRRVTNKGQRVLKRELYQPKYIESILNG